MFLKKKKLPQNFKNINIFHVSLSASALVHKMTQPMFGKERKPKGKGIQNC